MCVVGAIGVGVCTGSITSSVDVSQYVASPVAWGTVFVGFAFLALLAVGSFGSVRDHLQESLDELQRRTDELEAANRELHDRIGAHARIEWELAASEDRYRAVVEDQTELVCRCAPDGTVSFVNRAYCQYFGRSEEELIGRKFMPLIPEEDQPGVREYFRSLSPENPVATHERRVILPDGDVRWQRWTNRAIVDDAGEVIEFQGTGRDVTEQKRAEAALREEKDRAQQYLDVASVMLVVIDAQQRVTLINRKGRQILGRSCDEIVGRNWFDLAIPERERETVKRVFDRLMAGEIEPIEDFENHVVTARGEERVIAWHNTVLRDPSGKIVGTLASGEDVTQRRHAEQELERHRRHLEELIEERTAELNAANESLLSEISERRQAENDLAVFKWFTEAAGESLGMADLEGNITYANEALCRLLGEDTREDAIGHNVREYYPEAALDFLNGTVLPAVMSDGQWSGELPLRSRKGKVTDCIQAVFLIRDEQGEPQYLANVLTDITDRKRMEKELERHRDRLAELVRERTAELSRVNAQLRCDIDHRRRVEQKLRESETRARALIDTAPNIILHLTPDHRIVEFNPEAERLLGRRREEVLGKNYLELFVPRQARDAIAADIEKVLGGEPTRGYENPLRARDGSERAFVWSVNRMLDSSGQPAGIVAVGQDITERERAEDRLREMETQLAHVARLSTMGEMVAGIAHEVNQPFYAILNFAKAGRNVLAANDAPDLDGLRDWFEEIAASATQAGDIIQRLQGFVRRTEPVRRSESIGQIIEESVQLVGFEIRRCRIEVGVDVAEGLDNVDVDRVEIQQVLVNLLRNACEAMDRPKIQRRRISVRARAADGAVEVAVSDTGLGLPDGVGAKVLDAFVTTKPDGLGMGLAISKTIVEAHGGKLQAAPPGDGGATFRFTLPVAEEARNHDA